MRSDIPKLAVLGAGAVTAKRHLPALSKLGGKAVSLFDPSVATAQSVARRFDISVVATSAEEAVAAPGVEAVLIASPNSFHREQVDCSLAYGRHVLCEKPAALTLSDARAMLHAARRAGLVLQIGFHHRFSAEHECTKRLLAGGALGDVHAFNGVIAEPLEVVPHGFRNYRFNASQGGGFTIIDVGQHRLDQALDLFGDVAAVSCEMASVLDGHGLDDSVVLTLRMQSGAIGSLNWHRFSRGFASPMMVFGTRASLAVSAFITGPFQSAPISIYLDSKPEDALPPDVLNWTRPSRWWGEMDRGWTNIWPPRQDTFARQLRNFFDAIRGDSDPVADGEDGYKALEVVQAAYRAYKEQRTIELPLSPDSHCEAPSW